MGAVVSTTTRVPLRSEVQTGLEEPRKLSRNPGYGCQGRVYIYQRARKKV